MDHIAKVSSAVDTPLMAVLKQVAAGSLQPADAVALMQQQALGSQQVCCIAGVENTTLQKQPPGLCSSQAVQVYGAARLVQSN